MKIAVEGCCHGELDKIYDTIRYIEIREKIKIDLLICCGDFQAVRNSDDLITMAVPPKYRQMQSFHKYYSGEKVAPVLTLFIGGNHEASNHLWELPYGGWVAPNIYYLGISGVVSFGGIRIAGVSGIYKDHDYHKGRHEYPPFDESTKRSIYHVRKFDIFKMRLLRNPIDVFISHDWPRGVYNYGDVSYLLNIKKYFKDEIDSNTLGNPAHEDLLFKLRPKYWFSGHLHVKFAALVPHKNEDESFSFTKFLALDKCLPRRDFLQVIDIESKEEPGSYKLAYDEEWLGILKLTRELWSFTTRSPWLPESMEDAAKFRPTEDDVASVREAFGQDLVVPSNFQVTAPVVGGGKNKSKPLFTHPQTEEFCSKLGIENPCREYLTVHGKSGNPKSYISNFRAKNPDSGTDATSTDDSEACSDNELADLTNPVKNPDEISIGSDSDEEQEDSQTSKENKEGVQKRALSDTGEDLTTENISEPKNIARPFKMVRRNAAIYTSTEDESDGL